MESKIGEGQFGEVWKGRLKVKNDGKVDSITVAVKIMKVTTNSQPQLEMLHQEARLMRMYDHRNVVKLHGLVFSDTDVMVVMEFVSGGALNSYLKQNKLMPLIKASFCYDIAAGLAYLHSRNCMHRQAPEVLFHHIYMRESDVWSYGMLMSEIFNDGKVPFHDKPIAEIRSKIHDPKFRPFVPSFQVIYRVIPKHHLEGKRYEDRDHLENDLRAFFNFKSPNFYARGIVQPTIVDETEDHLIHDQRLKPFVPTQSPKRPSQSPARKDDQPNLLQTQPQNVIAKLRQSQQMRKSTSKK
ncbi:unnamed protein product [Heligmosomoides polygyrus]|uniref:Protein kinase domain-containing protein n=1 Tax=Heligmosomoides polygyrus TaxID=6339 RepID=A0A3P8B7V8_HELPZ|nr:unnamed protein product [Heligmosomoides polygyrus]